MSADLLRRLIKANPSVHAQLLNLRDKWWSRAGEREFELISLMCEPNMQALDVGANVGSVTSLLLGCSAHVRAFEPIPDLARVLNKRFRKFIRASQLEIVNSVVSDHEGEIEIFIPNAGIGLASVEEIHKSTNGSIGRSLRVACLTLDSLSLENVGFIKIDVEGHEQSVISGAMGLLKSYMPNLLIEAEERHHLGTVIELQKRLLALGYKGFFLLEDELCPIESFSADFHQRREHLSSDGTAALSGKTYVNNFLFFAPNAGAELRVKAKLARRCAFRKNGRAASLNPGQQFR